MVAIRTLPGISKKKGRIANDVLFGIICSIGEKAGKYSTCNSISTFHDDPMFVCMHELLVQQKLVDGVYKFAFEMCQYWRRCGIAKDANIYILQRVWKLK